MKHKCTSKGDVASDYCLWDIIFPLVGMLRCYDIVGAQGSSIGRWHEMQLFDQAGEDVSRGLFIVDEAKG